MCIRDSNSNGQYGGSEPEISVTGQPGDVVRVTLHKGFNPVITSDGSPNSVADVIQSRLDSTQPEFPVNNAFDVQTVDVVIGANGTATVASGEFDYNNTSNGISFQGDNVQPLPLQQPLSYLRPPTQLQADLLKASCHSDRSAPPFIC